MFDIYDKNLYCNKDLNVQKVFMQPNKALHRLIIVRELRNNWFFHEILYGTFAVIIYNL